MSDGLFEENTSGISVNGKLPLFAQTEFPRTAARQSLSIRNFRQQHSAVACPDAISSNGIPPLLAQTDFLRTAARQSLSMRSFRQRQRAVARPDAISSNGKLPLFVKTDFLRTAARQALSMRSFRQRRLAVACPDAAARCPSSCRVYLLHFCKYKMSLSASYKNVSKWMTVPCSTDSVR